MIGIQPLYSGLRSRVGILSALAVVMVFHGCGGDDFGCTGPFCVPLGSPEASKLTMGSGAGQTGAPGRELPQPIDVVVTDKDDRPVADVEVRFAVSQGGGSVSSPTVHSDIDGHAQVTWLLGPDLGAQLVQAAAISQSGTPLENSPLTVSAEAVPLPPAKLLIQTAPSDVAQNGIPLNQQPVIQVLDGDDQPVAGVQVAASIGSGGGTLNGTTAVVSDAAGLAGYTDLALVGSAGPRTVQFTVSSPDLGVASGPIQLNAGVASEIKAIQPVTYTGIVNSPVSPSPSVLVNDAAGNPVAGVAVTFTPDRDASVSPSMVVSNETGIAQVSSWNLGSSTDGHYTLSARVEGSALSPITFSATAKAGMARRLQIITQPSPSVQSGVALGQQPVVQIVDLNGNPAPLRDVTILATIAAGPAGALDNASAVTDGNGRASFAGLTLTGIIGSYTLTFSAADLPGVNSSTIRLGPGAPAKLVYLSAPPTARSRELLAPQPLLQVQDASGNAVTQGGIIVVASLVGDGTLNGSTTVTTHPNGSATYSDLSITGAPGPRSLSFTSATPALQASIGVTLVGVASVEPQAGVPTAAVVGSTVSNAGTWTLRDSRGNPVPDVPVAFSASSGGLVAPTSAISDLSGIVHTVWTLGPAAGDQFVEVAVQNGPSSQVHITAIPDVAAKLVKVSGDGQSANVNDSLPDLLVVQVTDQFNNGIDDVVVQWQACEGGETHTDTTKAGGFSSVVQPTGAEPSNPTFCTRASALALPPVEFTYTVTAAASSPSPVSSSESRLLEPRGPVPVAPQSLDLLSSP
jgi:hypothetical protein